MFCPACGANISDGSAFCEHCGKPLAQAATAGAAAPVFEPDPRMRGGPGGRPKTFASGKSPGMALFLSFLIPGVGQFYNGDTNRGLLILAIWFVSWFLLGAGGIGFIGLLGAWVWGMINAWQVASGKSAMM